jgi:hypothetical protein
MAAHKTVVKKLATIWECPDDLWENVVVPVLAALDPSQHNGRPRVDPRRALNGIIHYNTPKTLGARLRCFFRLSQGTVQERKHGTNAAGIFRGVQVESGAGGDPG